MSTGVQPPARSRLFTASASRRSSATLAVPAGSACELELNNPYTLFVGWVPSDARKVLIFSICAVTNAVGSAHGSAFAEAGCLTCFADAASVSAVTAIIPVTLAAIAVMYLACIGSLAVVVELTEQ